MDKRDKAAFALFLHQCSSWEIPYPAAAMEWETSPEVREFWLGQVDIVTKAFEEEDAA